MVAQVEALGHALVAVAATQHDQTLAVLEMATLEAIRAMMPSLLGAVLQVGTTSLQAGGIGRTSPCPGCGQRRPIEGGFQG